METSIKNLAPVALFVYNRLRNTREVVEALKNNSLASQTDLIIYSDGAKTRAQEESVARVREYLKSITGFKSVRIIERQENFYIEKNVIEGVTETVKKYGRIIVLEDDGITSPYFLDFINQALDFYEAKKKVMHIGTYTFIDMPHDFNQTFFWQYTENTGGGWATWSDRWEKFIYFQDEQEALNSLSTTQKNQIEMGGDFPCLSNLKLKPIPWDICWYMSLIRNEGLAVQTPQSLTVNNGLYNGTHFTFLNRLLGKNPFEAELYKGNNFTLSSFLEENQIAKEKIRNFYRTLGTRKRDKALHYFLRFLVLLKVTKLVKKLLNR
jgi:hypothetical protein